MGNALDVAKALMFPDWLITPLAGVVGATLALCIVYRDLRSAVGVLVCIGASYFLSAVFHEEPASGHLSSGGIIQQLTGFISSILAMGYVIALVNACLSAWIAQSLQKR